MSMPDSQTAKNLQELVRFLRERHTRVMSAESEALQRLGAGDTPGHTEKMQEKATLLANLAKDAEIHTAALSGPLRQAVMPELDRFSQNARNALGIGSVFYMSALLYPDDHTAGQPDNLLKFIDHLESKGEAFSPN